MPAPASSTNRRKPCLAQNQERSRFRASVRLRDFGNRATRSGLFLFGEERREFGELGFFHAAAETGWRGRWRHGERDRRLVRITRPGCDDWCADRRARWGLSCGIRLDAGELAPAFYRGRAERCAIHHMGSGRLWPRCFALKKAFPPTPAASPWGS